MRTFVFALSIVCAQGAQAQYAARSGDFPTYPRTIERCTDQAKAINGPIDERAKDIAECIAYENDAYAYLQPRWLRYPGPVRAKCTIKVAADIGDRDQRRKIYDPEGITTMGWAIYRASMYRALGLCVLEEIGDFRYLDSKDFHFRDLRD